MKKAERLNQELIFLKNKKTFNLTDLMREFKVSKRTALRDVQELEYMGLSVYVDKGKYGKYNILTEQLIMPLHFSLDEISSIFFAIRAIENLTQIPFDKNYSQIYDKLLETLSKEKREKVERLLTAISYNSVPSVADGFFLKSILDAILHDYAVEITYNQYDKNLEIMYPLNLFFQGGVWFLNGYNVDEKKWKIYRCDCIESCEKSFARAPFTDRDEAKRCLDEYNRSFHDISFECELTKLGREIFFKETYPNINIEKHGDSYKMIGKFNISELHYLVQYLIAFGNNIKIKSPQFLIENYKCTLKDMISAYN